jgi:hypothetical protein
MPCFNDPHGLRAAQLLGERTPTDTLLQIIEQALTDAVLRLPAAPRALWLTRAFTVAGFSTRSSFLSLA